MRNELEGRIVAQLQQLRSLESKLDRRFAGLSAAPSRARLSFLAGLIDLENRANGLAQLVDSLNEINPAALKPAVELRKETDNAANTACDFLGHHAHRRPSHLAV
jgi:hypothetical protein